MGRTAGCAGPVGRAVSTRLSVNINDDTARVIRRVADESGVTATEAVRRAVAVYEFFDDARNSGNEILLVDKRGRETVINLLV